MAEGGAEEFPMTEMGDHHDDADEKSPLIKGTRPKERPPFKVRMPPGYEPKKSSSTSHNNPSFDVDDNTASSENMHEAYISRREKEMEELRQEVLHVFPNIDEKKMLPKIRRGEFGKIIFNEGGPRSVDWEIASNGMPGHDLSLKKFPKGFRKSLGKTNVQINEENLERQKEEEKKQEEREQEQEKARKDEAANEEALQDARYRLGNLNEALGDKIKARKNASSHEEEDIDRDIARMRRKIKEVGIEVDDYTRERGRLEQATLDAEAQVVEGERAVENARERVNERLLSLRDRVKEIFKKHGFTVISVATAIAVVIGVIVSNLKAGLTKVAKGVGNGLKDLGKKLGEILPGMIGAIASFIFRTAGEVIGFLAKNAWLLIVGLVVLAVEQFKKKSR